MEAQPDAIKSW